MARDIRDAVEGLLVPMTERARRNTDATYFLHRNGSLVFSEGPLHPPGGLFGNVLYYPDEEGHNDFHGVPYASMNKRLVDGELRRIDHVEQFRRHGELFPETGRRDHGHPCAAFMIAFSEEEFLGFFDNRAALRRAREEVKGMNEAVEAVSRFLGVSDDCLGATGSLAYGIMDDCHDDVDLCVYADLETQWECLRRIDELLAEDPGARVFEFGREWPMRFHLEGTLFCPFFLHEKREDSLLHGVELRLLEEELSIEAVVTDDRHGIFMPPILGLEGTRVDGRPDSCRRLIAYTGIMRGELRRGHRFRARVRRIACSAPMKEAFVLTAMGDLERLPS